MESAEKSARDFADAGNDLGDEVVADAMRSAPHVFAVGRAARVIQVRKDSLHITATEGENALVAAEAPFFVRSGLVKPVLEEVPAARGRKTKVARLVKVTPASLTDYLSRSATWRKYDARTRGVVPCDVPGEVSQTILSREGEWSFRHLSAVITTPTLRPDGTILSEEGYDDASQLLLLQPPQLPKLPERPDKETALRALGFLDALLDEFDFVDDASRSVALSALMTPVVRGAISVAPLHAVSAPVAGSGKSFIVDLVSAITSGARAPVLTAASKEEENEKRLGAALMSGQPIISIDNVNGELGFDLLCQAVERPLVDIRILGASTLIKVESRASIYATGNNIRVVGDMTRRTILCSLDPQKERPELRTFKRDPFEAVLADRGKYIAAVLTICRAYVVAGCPDECSPLASFSEWSKLVRSALVWLGRTDPCSTMEAARADDPTTTVLRQVLGAWHSSVSNEWFTTGKIIERGRKRDNMDGLCHPDLFHALVEVAENRPGAGPNARALSHFLKANRGRVIDGLKFVESEDSHAKQKIWSVSRVD